MHTGWRASSRARFRELLHRDSASERSLVFPAQNRTGASCSEAVTSSDAALRIGSVRAEAGGWTAWRGACPGPPRGAALASHSAGPWGSEARLFSRVTSCFVYEGIWAKTKITATESGLVLGQWPQGPFRRCHPSFAVSQGTVPVSGSPLSVPWPCRRACPAQLRQCTGCSCSGRIVTLCLQPRGTEAPAGAATSRGSCAPSWGPQSGAGLARGGPAAQQTVQAFHNLGLDAPARSALTP